MKPRLLHSVLTVSALTIASLLAVNSPTRGQNSGTAFVCSNWQGSPATVAQTAQGDTVPVILWSSDYFGKAGFDPQTRCELVSQRFQQYYNNGTLNYLTTGRMNRMPVVCVAEKKAALVGVYYLPSNQEAILATLYKGCWRCEFVPKGLSMKPMPAFILTWKNI